VSAPAVATAGNAQRKIASDSPRIRRVMDAVTIPQCVVARLPVLFAAYLADAGQGVPWYCFVTAPRPL